jgi:probable HAF family extracellular repeat protein
VGFYVDSVGPGHGFLLDSGTFTTIDVPDDSGPRPTQITGINNRGQMVGAFVDAQGMLHAFLRDERGAITEIDHPDATPPSGAPSPFGTSPFGINEQGQIVGGFR